MNTNEKLWFRLASANCSSTTNKLYINGLRHNYDNKNNSNNKKENNVVVAAHEVEWIIH